MLGLILIREAGAVELARKLGCNITRTADSLKAGGLQLREVLVSYPFLSRRPSSPLQGLELRRSPVTSTRISRPATSQQSTSSRSASIIAFQTNALIRQSENVESRMRNSRQRSCFLCQLLNRSLTDTLQLTFRQTWLVMLCFAGDDCCWVKSE